MNALTIDQGTSATKALVIALIAVTLLAGDPVSRVLDPVVGTALLMMVVVAIFTCGTVILMAGVRRV